MITANDLAMFEKLRIPRELVEAAGIERVTDKVAREQYDICGDGDMSGLAFIYWEPSTMNNGRRRWYVRIRRDHPEVVHGKIKKKYVGPPHNKAHRHFYFPPAAELFADTSIPIALVEAEKSSLALLAWSQRTGRKLLPIAMGGVHAWKGQVGIKETASGERIPEKGPLPDLGICRDGRRVYVIPDANISSNAKVRNAIRDLLAELAKRRAETYVVELPAIDSVNGPDDLLGVSGDEAMSRLIEEAIPGTTYRLDPVLSEDELALRFTAQHGHELRYVARWGKWMRWNGTCWREDDTRQVEDCARAICRQAVVGKSNETKAIARSHTVTGVVRLASSDPQHAATVSHWDSDRWALNTPGGVIDLRTGELRPHSPKDYCSKITAVTPLAEEPVLWLKFLRRVTGDDRDLESFLQRIVGYSLTGSTREEALFFLYGTGANGKSKFLSTVAGMLGDYHRTAAMETFLVSKFDSHPCDIAALQGARLVTASETKAGRRWDESKIKTLTGGDRISARYMRCDFFEFTPQFKLLLCGNQKPGIDNVNEAIRRRFHLIPFTVTIPAKERDLNLAEKLKTEWPGILNWAIVGCLAWQREGLHAPKVVLDATSEYLAQEDAITRWLDECSVLLRSAETQASQLYGSFKAWCDRTGEHLLSQKRFSQALLDRGYKLERRSKGNFFVGIALQMAAGMPVVEDVEDRTLSPYRELPSTRPRARAHAENVYESPSTSSTDSAENPSNRFNFNDIDPNDIEPEGKL